MVDLDAANAGECDVVDTERSWPHRDSVGARVGRHLQERAELVAGMLLIVLGTSILVSTWMGLSFL